MDSQLSRPPENSLMPIQRIFDCALPFGGRLTGLGLAAVLIGRDIGSVVARG